MSSNGTIKYIRISCIAKVICWYKAGIVILVHIHSVSTVVSFGLLQVSALAGNLLRICTLLNQQALSKLFIQFCWLNSLFWNSQKVTNYNRYLKKNWSVQKMKCDNSNQDMDIMPSKSVFNDDDFSFKKFKQNVIYFRLQITLFTSLKK